MNFAVVPGLFVTLFGWVVIVGFETFGSAAVFAAMTLAAWCIASDAGAGKKRLSDLAVGTVLIIEFMCLPLFMQRHLVAVALILVADALITVALVILIVRSNRDRMDAEKALDKAWPKASRVLIRVLCVLLVIPAASGVYDQYFKNAVIRSAAGTSVKTDVSSETDFAALGEWDDLTLEDKELLIRRIARNEHEYLGISSDVELFFNEQADTIAYYVNDTKAIAYNVRVLETRSLYVCVNAILHEMHHAYVHDVVDSVDWSSAAVNTSSYYSDARRWRDSIENYVSSRVDYDAYYNSALETDARAYAARRSKYYLELADSLALTGDG